MKGETKCRCGCGMDITPEFRFFLESLDREMVRRTKREITINSGARCKAHNKAVKGSSNSSHVLGKAADIVIYDNNYLWHLLDVLFSVYHLKRQVDEYGNRGIWHIDTATEQDGFPYAQRIVAKY
jgi:uncharacterized protein YcbK (DUF882 family)